jgi:hypothetical protein
VVAVNVVFTPVQIEFPILEAMEMEGVFIELTTIVIEFDVAVASEAHELLEVKTQDITSLLVNEFDV